MEQELYATQLQLKMKNAFISELQNDVMQLQHVEDENIVLKTAIASKETDLRQWALKVIKIKVFEFNFKTKFN